MSDAMFMFGVTAGIFAFLAAVTFGARGARRRQGPTNTMEETRSSSTSGGQGKRVKKYNSDGTPVYE